MVLEREQWPSALTSACKSQWFPPKKFGNSEQKLCVILRSIQLKHTMLAECCNEHSLGVKLVPPPPPPPPRLLK
jgi:hypothetical protein